MLDYLVKNSINLSFNHFDFTQSDFSGLDFNTCLEIGAWFLSTGSNDRHIDLSSCDIDKRPFIPSIKHGRACVFCLNPDEEDSWVSIKGIGWTYGGPVVLPSPKDNELVFGLYDRESAKREFEVSARLSFLKIESPMVLGYVTLNSKNLPELLTGVSTVKYNSGRYVKPSLLYTKVKSPFRITDLQFMEYEDRFRIVTKTANTMGTDLSNYFKEFGYRLGNKVGEYHAVGCVNDMLDAGNITLCGEIVDYEWFCIPNIPLPDGASGLDNIECRKEKEIIYGIEALLLLNAYLKLNYSFYDILNVFISGYEKSYEHINNLAEVLKSRTKLVFKINYIKGLSHAKV